ncbi:retinitis pigmentosa 1-like 1 protein [Anolis sagrei]|uniref:retinitis pigmentosa 1-like 1 protein n=1 Tax=Anolis sagrei TaxID=38937 RepID=UPI0035229DAF
MTQPSADYLSSSVSYNYDQPLPPLARTNAVTQVPPAKKITFYKSGDPQFGGVKMAINQRSFKSFNALMDDLSHRVPLPFGVRTITTPRGIHCISTLDQLEDGGCYLCSDKKYVTPISIGAANRRTGSQKTSALRKAAHDGKQDDHSSGFAQQSPRIPKKVTLVKNGDITAQRPIILNRRNARSLKTLLDEISDIMQFTVKKLFTLDGRKIDSMQALLHCPNVLVCVGREPFKPMVKENPRKHSSEKLPGLTSRASSNNNGENQEMNFGLEAKKSVMHPRSSLSNRSQRFSLSSEKSSINGLTTSSENGAPFPRNCPHSKAEDLTHSLVNDDIEKKVHVNKDGSLSVEMKVRFRLLNDETLHWSTQLKKSMHKIPGEELSVSNDNGVELTENPEASSELDDASLLYPCDIDSYMSNVDESEIDEVRCRNCGKPCKDYDIWKNPMHISQKEEPGVRSTWYTHSSCSSTSSHRRIVRKKVASVDSIRTSSSGEEYSKHVVRESSHYSETVENTVEYREVKNCCCQGGCGQSDTSQRGTPEAMDTIVNSVSLQNEEEDAAEGGENINTGSRPGSNKSKSSQGSAESQIRICEKTSSLERTISSGSIKDKGELEDAVACSSPPNSVYSRSGKGSVFDGGQENADEVSENDRAVSSISMDSCAKKDAAGDEAEKEDEEINEIYSVSENPCSNPSIKDDTSECGRSSTARSIRSVSSAGNHRRNNSNEVHLCSAASASSRTSKKSKPSQNHLEVASNRSVGSSRGSTSSKKKKKPNGSFQAEDARSNSRASHYSRSSYEVDKRDSGHASQDSSPPHSHVSSSSEVAAPPAYKAESTSSLSRCYSRSSRNSQKENLIEGSIKVPSHCSSFSDYGGENGDGIPKVGSPEGSSRQGGVSESTCSKCGHITKPCRDDLRSTSSKVSSHSEARSRCAETEASRRSDDACSQSSIAMSSKPRRKKANSLHADIEGSSQVSASESMYSLRYPSPPKGRPSSRKSRPLLLKKSSKGTSACTESELIPDKEEKEVTVSQPPEPLNTEEGTCQEKLQEEAEMEPSASCGGNEIIPSSLPNASLEQVVHEWLRKIPSETLLMKCEMQDDGEGAELDTEIPGCSNSQELLEGDSEEKKEDTKEAESIADAAEPIIEGTEEEAVDEEPKEELNDEKVSEAVLEEMEAEEAKCNLSALTSQNNHKKDLPSTIQTSVQIMKALLASKQEPKMDRAHSLPEVSPTMGRKLSNSANILITCLASLQLLDEELDPSNKSSKGLNRPRYTELLNIFQALWCGHTSEKGGPSADIKEEGSAKVPSGYKGHCSKEGDFTPMSSSGVDVSSGDGGSGEGSVAGGRDHALSQEKTEEAKPAEEDAENAELKVGNEEAEEEASQPPKSEGGGEEVESVGGEEVTKGTEDCETEQASEKEVAEEGAVEESDQQENEHVECGEVNADGDIIQVESGKEAVEENDQEGNENDADGDMLQVEAEEEAVEETGQQDDDNVEGGEVDANGDTIQVEAEEEAMEETSQQEDENVEGGEVNADGETVQVEAEEETVEETGQQEDENVEGGEVDDAGETLHVEAEEEAVEENDQQEDENVVDGEVGADGETVQVEAEEESVKVNAQQEDENEEGGEADADGKTDQVEAEEESGQQEDENVVDGEADVDGETVQVEAEEEAVEESGQQENENVEGGEVDVDGEIIQVETQEDSLVKEAEDSPGQENVDQVTEEPSNHELTEEPGHNDPSAKDGNDDKESEIGGAKQTEADAQADSKIVPLQTPITASPMVQQRSIDPDPIWVLKLLKKIEKEFMTHYVSAMNDFKVKWNLPNSDEVNLMISELKEEVNRRIQKSIEKELKKIRSRAGRKIPRPPDELRRESTLQVENRRRRLQSIRKMSLYNDQNPNQSNPQETLSYEIDEDFIFSTIRDDDSELPSEEEYCPCDACIRKKIEARAFRGPVVLPVAANAPVVKAFDLHQILKMKKGSIPEKMVENSIAEEDQDEEAEGKTDELEVAQETEPEEGKEVGETDEKEEDQKVKEDEVEVLPDEAPENQNCEEAEGGEATNEEAVEEAKEEVGEEEGDEGKEGEVAVEEEEKEGEADKKEEEKEDAQEEEEVDVKVEEGEEVEAGEGNEEESVKEENEGEEVEEGDVIEEGEKEEVSVKEEEKEEEEAKGEEQEAEEKETETEEVETGEEMEKSVKEEEEKEEMEEEKEDESVKEEDAEGDAEEEIEWGVDEEHGGGEVAPDEAEEEKEEKSVKEGEEEVEEKEGGEEGEDAGEDVTLDEMEEEKEEQPVKDEEEEKEEAEDEKEGEEKDEEKVAEEGGEEVACEDNNQEEDKNEEEEKDVDDEQKEDEETEEEPKVEDEADGAAVEPEPEGGEGESQKDPTEDAENADDAEGLEAEAGEKEKEIEEDTEGGGGAEVVEEEDAKPEEDCEACSETAEAEEEGENKEGEAEAEEKEEEAEGEDGNVPEQTDGDEVDPETVAEEEEAEDCEEPSEAMKNLRKASAISSMGNCSQQSQKGSEDGSDGEEGEMNKDGNVNGEAGSNSEKKSGAMYADIEEEEEEEEEDRASSPGSGGKAEEPKTDEKEENNSQGSKKKDENTEVIDQDDLDF